MGDFIGSYYERNVVDETTLNQQMDILNSEQPAQILDMEFLEKRSYAERMKQLNGLPGRSDENQGENLAHHDVTNGPLLIETKESMDDDFDVPVASITTFDQAVASMVTLDLHSVGRKAMNEHFRQAGEHQVLDADGQLGKSPLPNSQTSAQQEEDKGNGERVGLKDSILNFWGRKSQESRPLPNGGGKSS